MTRFLTIVVLIGALATFAIFVFHREDAAPAPVALAPAVPVVSVTRREPVPAVAAFGGDGLGSLHVTIRSEKDGVPLAGVPVDAIAFGDPGGGRERLGARTGEDGSVLLEDVRAGPVWVLAGAASRYCGVAAGRAAEVSLVVSEEPPVVVEVVGAAGAPVAGAEVWMSSRGACDLGSIVARTDARGFASLGGGVRGRTIAARADGFAWSDRKEVEGDASIVQPANAVGIVLLQEARALRGRVVGPGAERVAAAWVGCRRDPGGRGPPAVEGRTDADGAFELVGLGPGEWTVEAWRTDLAPAVLRVGVGSEDPPPVVLTLTAGVTLAGRVTDGSRGLARVRIALRGDAFIGRLGETMTSEDGSFRIAHVPRGRLHVEAGYLAGDSIGTTIEVDGDAPEARWDPVLEPRSVLAGVVTDERGEGRAFVRVRAEVIGQREGWMAECVADKDGRFEIVGAPGDVAVEIDVPDWEGAAAARIEHARPADGPLVVAIPDGARPSAYVEGRLLDPEGNALGQTPVMASRTPGPPMVPPRARSRALDGSFRLGPIAPGAYVVEAVARSGARMPLAECAVEAGETLDLGEVALGREGFVKAFVDDAGRSGQPSLTVIDRLGRFVSRLRPVAGFAASGPLAPGAYVIRVEGPGIAGADVPFSIAEGVTTTVEVPVVRKG